MTLLMLLFNCYIYGIHRVQVETNIYCCEYCSLFNDVQKVGIKVPILEDNLYIGKLY